MMIVQSYRWLQHKSKQARDDAADRRIEIADYRDSDDKNRKK